MTIMRNISNLYHIEVKRFPGLLQHTSDFFKDICQITIEKNDDHLRISPIFTKSKQGDFLDYLNRLFHKSIINMSQK